MLNMQLKYLKLLSFEDLFEDIVALVEIDLAISIFF